MTQDLNVILTGVLRRILTPDQGAALMREQHYAADCFLGDRLSDIMNDPISNDGSIGDKPGWQMLELLWKLLGPSDAIRRVGHYRKHFLYVFLEGKLCAALAEFTEDDLIYLEDTFRETELHVQVVNARARRLIPIADQLLKNPAEINKDLVFTRIRG